MNETRDAEPVGDELFIRLFLSNERRIFGFILSLIPRWDEASDVLQDTASTLWQKFDQFEPGTDFMAWALTVARFRVLSYRKSQQHQRLRFGDSCLEELAAEAQELHGEPDDRLHALQQCIEKLEAGDRELVQLRYQPGSTTKSVAEVLGRSANSVYKLLNRIHRQLLYCVRLTLSAEKS